MAKLSGGKYSRPRGPKNSPPPQKSKARGGPTAEVESWLPPGWVVEGKVRSSGVAAGQIDKYYTDPVSGRKFRSKKEVLNFLETGAVPQKKRGMANAVVVKDSFDLSSVKKLTKSLTTTKKRTFKFDYFNVPQKIKWFFFTNSDKNYWTPTPFTGNEMVPESIAHEWLAAATDIVSGNVDDHPML